MSETNSPFSVPPRSRHQRLCDLLASIWLYIDWHYVTKQLTTPQKELFLEAVWDSLPDDLWDSREQFEAEWAWWRAPEVLDAGP